MKSKRPQTFAGVIGFLGVTTFALSALAQTESILLHYAAHPGCPPRKEFVAEVSARTSRVQFGQDEGARTFSVTFSRSGEQFSGKLEIAAADGEVSERAIEGEACKEVASGLALVLALAVDPEASTAPASELPTAPTVVEPTRPEPASDKTAKQAPAETTVTPVPAPTRPATSQPAAARYLGVGLDASLLAGHAPQALVAGGVHVRLHVESFGLRPRGTLGLFAAKTGIVGPEGELADFRVVGGQLELCPHRLELAAQLETGGCLVTQAASLHAEGRTAPNPGSASRLFIATGPGGFLVSQLTDDFYLEFKAAGLVNLTRDDFIFEQPRVVVHDVPLIGFSGGIALGFSIL